MAATANVLVLSVLAIAGTFGATACDGKPAEAPPAVSESASSRAEPAAANPRQPSAPRSPAAAPAETATAAAAPVASAPLASVLTSDPTTIQTLFDDTSHAAAATLRAKGTVGDDPIAKGLREFAKKAAPGMEPDGPLATGTLKEKQNIETEITLQPGKCYAIVGYSKKVKDLDLYLLLAPGILSGQDTTDDNMPVIGASPQPMCPVAVTPVTYKLGIVADRGAGEVAVQLYSTRK